MDTLGLSDLCALEAKIFMQDFDMGFDYSDSNATYVCNYTNAFV